MESVSSVKISAIGHNIKIKDLNGKFKLLRLR